MKIFALVVLSILAGSVLLVGSSYLAIYLKLLLSSANDRPITTFGTVGVAALFFRLARSRTLARWLSRRLP